MFRFFGCSERERFHVMPGGVARVAPSPRDLDESLASGTMSKDVWVLSDGPVKPITLLGGNKQSIELKRSAMDLPSRVAEHLFWLGRFAERTEFQARHARYCTNQLTSELATEAVGASWQLVSLLSDSIELGNPQGDEARGTATPTLRKAVLDFLLDRNFPDGLANSVQGIIRNASNIRDRLSFDSWQIISRLDYSVLIPWGTLRNSMGDTLLILNQIIGICSGFAGLASESMTRGPGWHFLDLGRRIDRAQNLLRLLDKLLVPVQSNTRQILESILDICDSSMTYRYRYLMNYELGPVLDLLVVDQSNPRGLAFQLMQIVHHLDALNFGDKTELISQRKRMAELRGSLRLFDSDAIAEESIAEEQSHSASGSALAIANESLPADPNAPIKPVTRMRLHLRRRLLEVNQALNELSDFLGRRFLTHTQVRQLQDMVNQ